jgi:hypothetical protein
MYMNAELWRALLGIFATTSNALRADVLRPMVLGSEVSFDKALLVESLVGILNLEANCNLALVNVDENL